MLLYKHILVSEGKIPFLKDTKTSYIRSAVSEEDPDAAAKEDRIGIDIVIERGGKISAVCQVKGSYLAEGVDYAIVPTEATGIDILDKGLYPAQTTTADKAQCVSYLNALNAADSTASSFAKLMKHYYKLLCMGKSPNDANKLLIKALYSADKVRKASVEKQQKGEKVTPLFVIASSKLP